MRGSFRSVVCLVAFATILPQASRADEPSEDQRAQLYASLSDLQGRLELTAGVDGDSPDAAVMAKAVEWMLRHREFQRKTAVADAERVLQWGHDRAAHTRRTALSAGLRTILGYRSAVDGSIQPYAISLPAAWTPESEERWPLHVVLHGRGDDLNEVAFITQHEGKKADPKATWIQLDVYGRGNNAYRWAGEVDVFEAIANVQKRFVIDDERITLWGFSMGGAGAWHLGLHHPDRWSSVGAGAGFVDFYRYQKAKAKLPDYQDKALRIYDSVGYSMNLADVPFITYGGEKDPQLAASLTMQEEAKKLGVPLEVLIGKNMGHKFDDVSFARFMKFHADATAFETFREKNPYELRFVTYTLKYNRCRWLTVDEQIVPYEKTTVESRFAGETLKLATQNTRRLTIATSPSVRSVVIDDGKELAITGEPRSIPIARTASGWQIDSAGPEPNQLRKRHNLQGPIDDAFTQPFVCVKGTSAPWNADHQKWAEWSLDRCAREWDQWFRGQIPIVSDSDVQDEQIRNQNLILFGDPGSNAILAKIIDRLPLKWIRSQITIAGKTWETSSHGLAMIFPNPLNPDRYVVINSGPTIHAEDFRKSNAWLFPRLGDAAVLKFSPAAEGGYSETTEWAAIMNSDWEFDAPSSPRADVGSDPSRGPYLTIGGRPVVQYNSALIKPPVGVDEIFGRSGHLHPLWTPSGKIVTEEFPADHLHQHAVFHAWVNTTFDGRKIDFWNQGGKTGTVLHQEVVGAEHRDGVAGLTTKLWHVALREKDEPQVALNETLSVQVPDVENDRYRIIDVQTRQECFGQLPLTIHEYHYGGFAVRGAADWFKQPESDFLTSEGKTRKDGNHTRPKWVAMHGLVDGQPCGIAVIGHPTNFRSPQPVRLHPDKPYFVYSPPVLGEFEITPDKPYSARYRIVTFDGPPDSAMLDQLTADFSATK